MAGPDFAIPWQGTIGPKYAACREVFEMRASPGAPHLITCIISLGDLRAISTLRDRIKLPSGGSATATNRQLALRIAKAEALERYSAAQLRPVQVLRSSAEELGSRCIDLDTIAQCSSSEFAYPHCPVGRVDRAGLMRWIRGVSLHTGEIKLLPAVMAFSGIGVEYPAERFWMASSTGCAAHQTYISATLRALLEVIERDAVSILWLQRLTLPRAEIDHVPSGFEEIFALLDRRSRCLEYNFFDATTDLGVPTVYGVRRNLAAPRLMTVVACASAVDIPTAVAKVVFDLSSADVALRSAPDPGTDWDVFTRVTDGAVYMAHPERLPAFDFLFRKQCAQQLRESKRELSGGEDDQLRQVITSLRTRGIDAFAIDLTTDEAIREGLRVVRVVAPQLQPLSSRYRARFLGNPRLYDAPAAMGYESKPEQELNSWPQPFA